MIDDVTPRTHLTGGFLLMVAGIAGVIISINIFILTLVVGIGIPGIPSMAVMIIAGAILVFGSIEFIGGWSAYRGRNWYGSIAAGILGILSIVTLPLSLIGTLLIAVSENHFTSTGANTSGSDRSPDGGTPLISEEPEIDELMDLIEFQRLRLDELERELDNLRDALQNQDLISVLEDRDN